MEILMHIEIRQDPPAERVMSEVIEHTVCLIKQSLLIDMLHTHLVAICFPNGTVLIRPLIPDVAVEVMHVVRLPLPDPQDFIHGALQSRPPQRQCGELLPEVVPVADTKLLDRVGRRSVRPVRPDLLSARIRAILQNVSAHVDKNMITLTHVLLLEDADLCSRTVSYVRVASGSQRLRPVPYGRVLCFRRFRFPALQTMSPPQTRMHSAGTGYPYSRLRPSGLKGLRCSTADPAGQPHRSPHT